MTAGSDLVFDHLSHNHIEPRAEYHFCLDVRLVHSDLSLEETLLFARGDPLGYFLFQPVHYDWCNKGRGVCYPVCGMVHIKEPLQLIGKSSPCGGSGFPLSLFEWAFTICLTPYNLKYNVLSASLNKTLPSFIVFVSTTKRLQLLSVVYRTITRYQYRQYDYK